MYMAFRDSLSNTTADTTDAITLDQTAPTFTFNASSGPECTA